jgi:hypothetical protein
MDSKRQFASEVESMAKQLCAIRRKKVQRMKTLISKHEYGIRTNQIVRSLFLSK